MRYRGYSGRRNNLLLLIIILLLVRIGLHIHQIRSEHRNAPQAVPTQTVPDQTGKPSTP